MTEPFKKSLDNAYDYCKKLTLEADSNFALSFKFLPKPKQDAIYAVYAVNRCADDFADEIFDDHERLDKLEQWEHFIDECYRGRATHPVMIAFTDAIQRYNIPIKPFKDAIEGFRMDLDINRYKTFEELKRYCDRVAGTISIISLHIFGWLDKRAFEYGHNLSFALQLTNIIRDVGEDIGKNRIYIPLDEIRRFGYSEEELLSRTRNENFDRLMTFQIERAQSYFRKANPLIRLVSPDARFTVLMIGAVYARLLRKITDRGVPVLTETTTLNTWEKLQVVLALRRNETFVIN